MEVKIEVPEYSKDSGLQYNWVDGSRINVEINKDTIVINANKEGLESLANHLLNLAQNAVPVGHHLHFDEYNSLDEGSVDLIIQKQ